MNKNVTTFIHQLLNNLPSDWLTLTTHRLDIYNEDQAKTEFLVALEKLYQEQNTATEALSALPTAYDYIRLGHPLSTVLEWLIAKKHDLDPSQVISFSSYSMPILAVLRTNALGQKANYIHHTGELPSCFNEEKIRSVYGYNFELIEVDGPDKVKAKEGSNIYLTQQSKIGQEVLNPNIDFYISTLDDLGAIITVNGESNSDYVGAIQHVRRRESIAMTPENCHRALVAWTDQPLPPRSAAYKEQKAKVQDTIQAITATQRPAILASSGLSMQYGIMMGLIDDALEKHPNKEIKIIVPPNCYGGTNDQARRVAACAERVEILDLLVDGDNDMVPSCEQLLEQTAQQDAIPYIIAEIPTNPRVEVPDLNQLQAVLSKPRKTRSGAKAVAPVFILDQTFCPNVQFLKPGGIFNKVKAISYVSGSKFPSGGKCTAGYCVANEEARYLMDKIEEHLSLCDNMATSLQMAFLAEQMPSMNVRIKAAYENTREFVNFIEHALPEAKINFVSEELAAQGFTPSVFSLDLPTKGNNDAERESYKRMLNQRLINMMISEIPEESKYCVSYGQLSGCYWTIPATSTQGTTKEDDKDYIARVSVSPELDLDKHKQVFKDFVTSI